MLNSWDLDIKKKFCFNDKEKKLIKMFIYEPSLHMVNILYDNEFIRTSLKEENENISF